jgi:hypothetical protein
LHNNNKTQGSLQKDEKFNQGSKKGATIEDCVPFIIFTPSFFSTIIT